MYKKFNLFLGIFLFIAFLLISRCSRIEQVNVSGGKDYIRSPYGVLSKENIDYPPVLDEDNEPFDWYRNPRYVIGIMGGPEETLITRDGYLTTDFATLKFYNGENLNPIKKRVKTLKNGYLPIINIVKEQDSIKYEFEYFADIVKDVTRVPYNHYYGIPRRLVSTEIDNIINFARIKIVNNSIEKKKIDFGIGLSTENIEFIEELQANKQGPERPSKLYFDRDLKAIIGEDKFLYMVSISPDSVIAKRNGDEGILKYEFELEPSQNKIIIVKMPYFVGQEEDILAIKEADYEKHLEKTINFWEDILNNKATKLYVPEDKVLNTYKANIIFSLIGCLDIVDEHYFYHANATCYDAFWMRDCALNLRGLDIAGFNDIVEKAVLIYLDWQDEEGQFVGPRPEEWDGHGQAMWALGHHYLLTRDENYAKKVLPFLSKGMEWQWKFRKKAWDESEGLLPFLHMADNEGVRGHLVGYNLWAISGAKGATWIAEGLEQDDLYREWEKRYQEYEEILKDKCEKIFLELGVVPPAIEGLKAPAIRTGWYGDVYGIDWGNLMLVYTSGVFDPWDKMVTGSLKEWRLKTFEGIFGYPINGEESILHSYTPLYISETYVIRGEQWEALRDLYSHLVHTSSTHMASEGMNAAGRWGWGPETWTIPHGEFSGKYLSFVRDMLILEWDGCLHIGKVLSPSWLKKGSIIKFEGPTYFGEASFTMNIFESGIKLNLNPPTRNPPKNIIIHAPQNVKIVEVIKDGKPWKEFTRKNVTLPPLSKETKIEIKWEKVEDAPPLSFDRAVKDYKSNYKKMVEDPIVELVGNLEVSKTELDANELLTVSATVRNKGGAGWLEEDISLFVDNVPIMKGPKELSRGIGFTSPEDIVSFRRNEEGELRINFNCTLNPGTHEVTIGMGKESLLPPETVTVKQYMP
jgi:hypothetical protein